MGRRIVPDNILSHAKTLVGDTQSLEKRPDSEVQLNRKQEPEEQKHQWPLPFDDNHAALPTLPSTHAAIKHQLLSSKTLLVRSITWNQQARPLPSVKHLQEYLLHQKMYHIISIGSQECINSISKSAINPRKDHWEKICREALGNEYQLVIGHALQATHLAIYVHEALLDLISDIKSYVVATGICDTLGNKGGIGISLRVGMSTFCFLTAHLSAHQGQVERRIAEFHKITKEINNAFFCEGDRNHNVKTHNTCKAGSTDSSSKLTSSVENTDVLLLQNEALQDSYSDESFCDESDTDVYPYDSEGPSVREIQMNFLDRFDFVFWAGDFNFRIFGTRNIVDSLLLDERHDVLFSYDQLNMLMKFDETFVGLVEGPLNFRPTYKFDKNSDVYDTSKKRRIPAWTDRILFKPKFVDLLSYSCATEIRTSDHRPVYATFRCSFKFNEDEVEWPVQVVQWQSESRSQVCTIS